MTVLIPFNPPTATPEEEAQENALQNGAERQMHSLIYPTSPNLSLFVRSLGVKVIWVANIFIPTNKAVYPVQYLLDNGVEVVAVELGNETYSQVDHDFGQFLSKSQGLHGANQWTSYFIPCCANGKPFRKDHQSGTALCNHIAQATTLLSQVLRWARIFRLEKQPVDTLLAQSRKYQTTTFRESFNQ